MPFPPYPNMMPYMENEDYQDSVDSDDMWSAVSDVPLAAEEHEAAKEPEAAEEPEAAKELEAAAAKEREADDVQYVSGPTPKKVFFPKKVNVETGIRIVVIYALGMENLPGVKYWQKWDERLTTSIVKVFTPIYYNVVHVPDMFVDAMMFHEDRCPRGHCGEHESFIRSIVDHRGFERWLARFKGHFEDENASYSTPERAYVIATCCKAGIHRSVAAAAILQHIMKNLGIHCEVVWLSKSTMKTRGTCTGLGRGKKRCDACASESRASYFKRVAFDDAFRKYMDVRPI